MLLKNSSTILGTCDRRLVDLFTEVAKVWDIQVIEGMRSRGRQDQLVKEGKSQTPWPKSKHNKNPSMAVDVAPSPVDWSDRERFTLFAGYVLGVAKCRGFKIRWGGDWNQDTRVKDNKFDDLVHFEVIE